mgnify:CR=1 FL=1
MTARAGVAEFTRVSEVVKQVQFDVPESEAKALSTEVQGQLAGIPTQVTDLETCRRAKESLPLLKKAEDRVLRFFNCDPDGTEGRGIKPLAYKAWKALCDKETAQLKPIQDLRKILNSADPKVTHKFKTNAIFCFLALGVILLINKTANQKIAQN